MTRTERLTERAISFAIAEADEDLAVARLAFLAHGDHAALDAAIDACLARTERTLYTRWRAISFLVRVRYEDQLSSPPDLGRAGQLVGGSGDLADRHQGESQADRSQDLGGDPDHHVPGPREVGRAQLHPQDCKGPQR
jgi:hypothetical protein